MDRTVNLEPATAVPLPGAAKGSAASSADVWPEHEVLPLEALLMQYLERNWRNASDIPDFRQDVYVRVYEAALKQIPDNAKQFVLTTARNLLINRVRHERVVPIETAADFEDIGATADMPGPERIALARDELRHLQAALDRLPLRCREAFILRRINGTCARRNRVAYGYYRIQRIALSLACDMRACRHASRRTIEYPAKTMNRTREDHDDWDALRVTDMHAAEFVERRDGANWAKADEAALEQWLLSPANGVAFLRLNASWKRTERLIALRTPNSDGMPRSGQKARTIRTHLLTIFVLMLALEAWLQPI